MAASDRYHPGDTVRPLTGPLAGRDVLVVDAWKDGYVVAPEGSATAWFVGARDVKGVTRAKRSRAGERAREDCRGCGRKRAACECLELHLARDLAAHGIGGWVREYEFLPGRKFRADFAWPELGVLVEVEGGSFRSRHREAAGFARDLEKYNGAALLGYLVLRFDSKMVKGGTAAQTIASCLQTRAGMVNRVAGGVDDE